MRESTIAEYIAFELPEDARKIIHSLLAVSQERHSIAEKIGMCITTDTLSLHQDYIQNVVYPWALRCEVVVMLLAPFFEVNLNRLGANLTVMNRMEEILEAAKKGKKDNKQDIANHILASIDIDSPKKLTKAKKALADILQGVAPINSAFASSYLHPACLIYEILPSLVQKVILREEFDKMVATVKKKNNQIYTFDADAKEIIKTDNIKRCNLSIYTNLYDIVDQFIDKNNQFSFLTKQKDEFVRGLHKQGMLLIHNEKIEVFDTCLLDQLNITASSTKQVVSEEITQQIVSNFFYQISRKVTFDGTPKPSPTVDVKLSSTSNPSSTNRIIEAVRSTTPEHDRSRRRSNSQEESWHHALTATSTSPRRANNQIIPASVQTSTTNNSSISRTSSGGFLTPPPRLSLPLGITSNTPPISPNLSHAILPGSNPAAPLLATPPKLSLPPTITSNSLGNCHSPSPNSPTVADATVTAKSLPANRSFHNNASPSRITDSPRTQRMGVGLPLNVRSEAQAAIMARRASIDSIKEVSSAAASTSSLTPSKS